MSAAVVVFDDLLKDVRHESARAAGDLAEWLAFLKVEGKADRTLYEYARKTAPLLRQCPDKAIGEFTAADINLALGRIPDRSRYISRSIYNAFFTWAEDDERIETSPMRRVAKMRQPKRRPKDIYSLIEVAKFVALEPPHGPLLELQFGTGMRRGECTSLRRDSIDTARARLMVYAGKGDKDRIIPLFVPALSAIKRLDEHYSLKRDDYLWALVRKKRYRFRKSAISDSSYGRWWSECVEAAGVRYLNPHQTRHTYGWRLRDAGFDIEERQLLMGHENPETTIRYYGHLTIEDVEQKMVGVEL